MELVHYFGGWVEGPSKQTDRTDGVWVQSTFGAKAEQIMNDRVENFAKIKGKKSVPALELLSRAVSSVGIFRTVPTVPTQGAIPEEGGYEKKIMSEKPQTK